jgi:hypothetical protein
MTSSAAETSNDGNGKNISLTKHYQNPRILREGCSVVTVLLMDPNVGTAGALWTLASVAKYIRPVETTSILIQTSICQEESPDDEEDSSGTGALSMPYLKRAKRREDEAQPLFRRMINQ